ncbi:ParB/RepB/Spo0J family partition protein [Candidatus Odyssella thessalonicensis]|uniref:ParB/RepB/Spo0J family partition protein n=1 Tax=Candidatus Odyssella thessalonicensis TaxID=84647 RepID=UPI0005280270|nr:ParB/RepB/Spo0J family partition protein [Candidatus Odyssella thessalonicensis]
MMKTSELKRPNRPSLGRGLSALLGDTIDNPVQQIEDSNNIDIHLIKPGKYQPRRRFDDEQLASLIDSVKMKGIIQPLVVRPLVVDGRQIYEIIAGERRWRAARTLGLEKVPVVIRDYSDREALETAIIENIQRDDLTPIEEAEAYQRLMKEFDYTQEELARSIGKSRSHVANMLRLMNLPENIKDLINEGKISAGHARTLIKSPNMDEMVQSILTEGMNVREAEKLAKQKKMQVEPSDHEVQSQQIEAQLAQLLGLKCQLKINRSGGTLTVHFNSYEEIDDLITKLRMANV